jgi:hypothetical protein
VLRGLVIMQRGLGRSGVGRVHRYARCHRPIPLSEIFTSIGIASGCRACVESGLQGLR